MTSYMVDYPDDVVANYMQRVRTLSPAARRRLDVHLLDAFLNGVWLTHPMVMLMTPVVIIRSWRLIHDASWTLNGDAAREYRTFFGDLSAQGWTLGGRGRIAFGLLVLRRRLVRPELAFRAYRTVMDAYVPHRAIGWVIAAQNESTRPA